MEVPEVVSVRKFRDFNARQKHELYETLLEMTDSIDELPKKSLRKTLELTLAVLEYKGEQVVTLQRTLERSGADAHSERRLNDENEKLQRMLEKLDSEKDTYKEKVKELTDEIFQLQKRLQEAAQQAEASDKDSSDPLSELDKQEELLRNINTKNKHIKRLLREIETLQNQNIEQSKMIVTNENDLADLKEKMLQLSADITLLDNERKTLKSREQDMSIELTRLEGNVTYLEEEREKNLREMQLFADKYEAKAQSWKKLLDEKERELQKLRGNGTKALATTSSSSSECTLASNGDNNSEGNDERTNLRHLLELRDKQIEELDAKLKTMTGEMIASTQLMNKLSAERVTAQDPQKPRACCKMVEESLRVTNERCQQLSELLERAEEDNVLKSKQALDAINALETFKRGDDGLVPALRKCASLEQKLAAREKELRSYVVELNSMHEIVQENIVLRKRLKIPDDVIVIAKNLMAKERNKDKMIERLTLKLRTSEELRLQLKLEKSQLRKEILTLEKRVQKSFNAIATPSDGLSLPSEIGEVPESAPQELAPTLTPASQIQYHMCGQCRGQGDGAASTELQTKYEEVLAENETLRVGMYEILEKLREYNASSDHITIDTELLRRLIEILPSSNVSNIVSPKRLQNELTVLKAREEALRELLKDNRTLQTDESETGELSSVQSMRDIPDIPKEEAEASHEIVDSSTRPTTPNKMLTDVKLPVVAEDVINMLDYNNLQQQVAELQIYRKHFEELKLHLAADGNDLKRINQELTEQLVKLELSALQQTNSYTYMRDDYDKLLSTTKQQEMLYINDTTDLRRQLTEHQLEISRLTALQENAEERTKYSEEEFQQLEHRNMKLSMQLAHLVQEVLTANAKETLQDICMEYGVIQDDYQLDFVTAAEYEEQRATLTAWREKQAELQRQNKQLEGLLEVANVQIQSQQRLLNEITDNHINLRHLVADLQSTTEEKLLLAKMQRDLDSAKLECERIQAERNELQINVSTLQAQLKEAELLTAQTQKDFQNERKNKDIKIKFLQRSLFTLKEKYAKFTPLVFLTNFVFAYTNFTRKLEAQQKGEASFNERLQERLNEIMQTRLVTHATNAEESEQLIKLIKTETHAKLVEENYQDLQVKYAQLQNELTELRLRHATEIQHWQTIEALFSDGQETITKVPPVTQVQDQHVATNAMQMHDVATNTDAPVPAARKTTTVPRATVELVDMQTSPIGTPLKPDSPVKQNVEIATQTIEQASVEPKESTLEKKPTVTESAVQTSSLSASISQAVQTSGVMSVNSQAVQTISKELTVVIEEKSKAEITDEKLKEIQDALNKANERIMELEKMENATKVQEASEVQENSSNQEANVVEKTILSFHTLLMEKDNSINKYQDLLQTEREQNQSTICKLTADNETLRSTLNNLNFNIKTKDIEIIELKAKLEVLSARRNKKPNRGTEGAVGGGVDSDESGADNSLNELTDEKLEEMFEDTESVDKVAHVEVVAIDETEGEAGEKEKQDTEELKEVPTLEKQIKELKDKVIYGEKMLASKDDELTLMKEKLKLCQDREKSLEGGNNPEIEQLRLLLEEKDKHINDLMETLKSFHDDQQRYINDTSNYSADQITKLAVDLNRTEATNKIYQTQVDALRRQLASLAQREKQARELNQSLRSQLIKRPVVSIKTELNARVKNENLQKRIQQLEIELDDTRGQLKRQETLLEAKRARSANEISLWEKQKRWQQNAEKLKTKLEETESALEKTRSLLQAARTTIARLEKDKHMLELKVDRRPQQQASVTLPHNLTRNTMKCCRTPSCPNLQHVGAKFTPSPSESPETYTGPSSECSSPVHHSAPTYFERNQPELIDALKDRIELQQRKIIAMELEGKGSNALTTELEKMQERCQMVESQNLRLESKNLELQLENNVLKQSDATERLQKRIKHLEDYIIALKEEMARLDSRRDICKCSGIKVNTQQGQSAEQTILSLRNLVEKLRSENKYLKDGRRSVESRSSNETPTAAELHRIQQMYAEAMEKLAALQEELGMKSKCSNCCSRSRDATNEELKYIKEQLVKKTQLLQKAKVLLTRAAAKEKVLKEQLMMWKRKCSELQNVPVIDEISE